MVRKEWILEREQGVRDIMRRPRDGGRITDAEIGVGRVCVPTLVF